MQWVELASKRQIVRRARKIAPKIK